MSCLVMHVILPPRLMAILLNEPKVPNKALTHLAITSHFYLVIKLIFYGATLLYSQTTFPKN